MRTSSSMATPMPIIKKNPEFKAISTLPFHDQAPDHPEFSTYQVMISRVSIK